MNIATAIALAALAAGLASLYLLHRGKQAAEELLQTKEAELRAAMQSAMEGAAARIDIAIGTTRSEFEGLVADRIRQAQDDVLKAISGTLSERERLLHEEMQGIVAKALADAGLVIPKGVRP